MVTGIDSEGRQEPVAHSDSSLQVRDFLKVLPVEQHHDKQKILEIMYTIYIQCCVSP